VFALVTLISLMNSEGIWSISADRSPWGVKPAMADADRTPSTVTAFCSGGVPRSPMPTISPDSLFAATLATFCRKLPMLPSATLP